MEELASGGRKPGIWWRVGQNARRVGRWGFDLLYPPTCPCCGANVDEDHPCWSASQSGFCSDCLAGYPSLLELNCDRCGVRLGTEGRRQKKACAKCRRRRLQFTEGIALGRYEGEVRGTVLQMKGRAGESLAAAMGRLMAERLREAILAWGPDLVTPIPMHWSRRWLRGTNGAETLAQAVARSLHLRYAGGILRVRRNIKQQHMLDAADRFLNVRAAYRVTKSYAITGASLLLVDDILTTGATASAAARCLHQAGAQRVFVAVLGQASNL